MNEELSFNCETHGYIKNDEVRIVTIKKKEYKRCRECQKEKDKKHAKKYRNKNKEYYGQKKKEHYENHSEMQIERNRRYREKLKKPK